MKTYLDNEREGAEIGLQMPIQFSKIPSCKTITEIQFRYRCYQFKIMTSRKCRQVHAPKRAPNTDTPNVSEVERQHRTHNETKSNPATYLYKRDVIVCNSGRILCHDLENFRQRQAPKRAPKRTQKNVSEFERQHRTHNQTKSNPTTYLYKRDVIV